MQIYKEVMEPARKAKEFAGMKCDICGRETDEDHWGEDDFERIEVEINHEKYPRLRMSIEPVMAQRTTVKLNEAMCYPGDCYGETTSFDICPDCFKDKLIPWIKSQSGAEPRKMDY